MENTGTAFFKNRITHPGFLYSAYVLVLAIFAIFGDTLIFVIDSLFGTHLLAEHTWLPIYIFVFALFALSIITTILNWQWFKRHWHINVILFVITGFLIAMILFNHDTPA